MSKLGEGMIEEMVDRIPNGNFMYEYNNRYGTYTVYFTSQDDYECIEDLASLDYACIEDLTEVEVIAIVSALYKMCEKAGNK